MTQTLSATAMRNARKTDRARCPSATQQAFTRSLDAMLTRAGLPSVTADAGQYSPDTLSAVNQAIPNWVATKEFRQAVFPADAEPIVVDTAYAIVPTYGAASFAITS